MAEEATEEVIVNALDPSSVEIVPDATVDGDTPAPITDEPQSQPELDLGTEVPPVVEKKPKEKSSVAPKWAMDRINENQNKADRLAEELAKERREKAEALALLERQRGDAPAIQQPRTQEPDIEALIDARAEQKLFVNDCNVVAHRGQTEIPGFNEKLGLLRTIGVVSDDFLKDIFAVDKDGAHTILDTLSQDPERASIMVKMDSRRRISEITRMTMAQIEKPITTAPKPVAISKAPAPKPVLEAVRAPEAVNEDEMTDAQWSAWRKKQMAKSA